PGRFRRTDGEPADAARATAGRRRVAARLLRWERLPCSVVLLLFSVVFDLPTELAADSLVRAPLVALADVRLRLAVLAPHLDPRLVVGADEPHLHDVGPAVFDIRRVARVRTGVLQRHRIALALHADRAALRLVA